MRCWTLQKSRRIRPIKRGLVALAQFGSEAKAAAPAICRLLEDHTDLNLLRDWARVLKHRLANYTDKTPSWRNGLIRGGGAGIVEA